MAAVEVLKEGARRKIGNGMSTKVCTVSWLPCVETGFVTTPLSDQLRNIRVSSFINLEEHVWDMDVINDVCNSRDAQLIKRVPIPMTDISDSLCGPRGLNFFTQMMFLVTWTN